MIIIKYSFENQSILPRRRKDGKVCQVFTSVELRVSYFFLHREA